MPELLAFIIVMTEDNKTKNPAIDEMFKAGVQYGYSKSRRHPSAKDAILGVKNRVEIFNLEKTVELLEKAKSFVKTLAQDKKQILFVGGKNEARVAIKTTAEKLGMPYVAGRWIGGSLTNTSEMKRRIARLLDLVEKRDKGELQKYTNKERLLFDREIDKLEKNFRGLVSLKGMPSAIFIVDPKFEKSALREAIQQKVPIISLLNTDCNMDDIDYPIPGNDATRASVEYFAKEIASAYEETAKS